MADIENHKKNQKKIEKTDFSAVGNTAFYADGRKNVNNRVEGTVF